MRFIGDVHGKIERYLDVRGDGPSFQLGDMGMGFPETYLPHSDDDHRFIRGNHDEPETCRLHSNYAGEWGTDEKLNMFFCGGAYSIDKDWRVQFQKYHGRAIWWPHEELWRSELEQVIADYKAFKPRIVATHDCPARVSEHLLKQLLLGTFRPEKLVSTRTGEAFQTMFEAWQPEIWLFGHYHIDKNFDMEGTRFICLNELGVIDL